MESLVFRYTQIALRFFFAPDSYRDGAWHKGKYKSN
jgi:hypothetical protein